MKKSRGQFIACKQFFFVHAVYLPGIGTNLTACEKHCILYYLAFGNLREYFCERCNVNARRAI